MDQATSSSRSCARSASRREKLEQLRSQCATELEYEIESSKEHWTEPDSETSECLSEEALMAENREVFARLMARWRSPATGQCFFHDWGDRLKVGEKIAESGQAEIFAAELRSEGHWFPREEIVVKVFKSGYALKDLERLWPRGMFNQQRESRLLSGLGFYSGARLSGLRRYDIPTHFIHKYCCFIHGGTLLKNGRFAFVLGKYWGDLRKLIDLMRRESKEYCFQSNNFLGQFMFEIARGMQKLHSYGILHRDLKASNVLVHKYGYKEYSLDVADFESSVGTIGTGFWRAPEVLYALENRRLHPTKTMEGTAWTKAGDVYGYAMTCYELMTGCLPFEDVEMTANDVINGARPLWRAVDDIHDSLHRLVIRCWHPVPSLRPSFNEIVAILREENESGVVPPSPTPGYKNAI